MTFLSDAPDTPEPFQINSSVSFQVVLSTRIICVSTNSMFQLTACSDPDRVEVLVLGVTEVLWLNKTRIEFITCEHADNKSLNHSISGLDASFDFLGTNHQVFQIANSTDTMNVSFVELFWNLEALGQAPGALLKFNIFFFTQNETIIFEDQMVDVFNGTVKTSYEVNFGFKLNTSYATRSKGVTWNIPRVACIFLVYPLTFRQMCTRVTRGIYHLIPKESSASLFYRYAAQDGKVV